MRAASAANVCLASSRQQSSSTATSCVSVCASTPTTAPCECVMLSIAVLSCERAARPGRADRTVTRHLSQAGSYQVTTARTGRPDATDAAPGPGIDRSAATTPNGVSFVVGQIPSPNTARVCSLFRRELDDVLAGVDG